MSNYPMNWLINLISLSLLIFFYSCQNEAKEERKAIKDSLLKVEEVPHEKTYISLAKALENPEKVYKLKIKDDFVIINADVAKLINLEDLEIIGRLDSIPKEIGELKNLKNFYVKNRKNNKLKYLPTSIGNLKSLEILEISGNLLEIPTEIAKLEKLKKLDLGYNQLTFLPESMGNLKSLEGLFLYRNQLQTIPNSFENLKKLQKLDFRYNPLPKLEVEQLKLKLANTQIFFN